ncbi:MAG: TonB-dependent receptor [Chromatiales bacterium]|nr:MAG: TonB-dependent receptor [Chromatiales bacterium]
MVDFAGRRVALPCVLFSLAVSMPVPAQEPMEQIIVTARKREESLQEVPLSISAFTAEQLESRGVTNNYEVALFTPNFSTQRQVGRTLDRPTIRGMAASSVDGEPNASYFVDGVYVASSISSAITDAVERVEVLRGPQSAQFGRATFAGAINYVTKQPTDEWEAQVNAKAGEDEDYKIGGWVSGPLIQDELSFLVSGVWEKWDGEWRNNLQPNTATNAPFPPFGDFLFDNPPTRGDRNKLGGEDTKDFLFKLRWTPTDTTVVTTKLGYTEADDAHFAALVAPVGESIINCYLPVEGVNEESGGAFCGTWDIEGWENRKNLPDFKAGIQGSSVLNPDPPASDADRFASPADPGLERETTRFLADVTQAFGDWEVVARGAYNKDDFKQTYDLDHTEIRALSGLFSFDQSAHQHDYAGELKVLTPGESRLRGSLGAYYYFYERNNKIRSFVGPSVSFQTFDNQGNLVTAGFPTKTRTRTENIAWFGSVDFDITERWTFAVEGRWAQDTQQIRGGNLVREEEETDNFTPRYTLRYTASDDLMVYGQIAKGTKPADFNDDFFRYDIVVDSTFDAINDGRATVSEEEQWTYEVGIKSTWLDQRLTANLAGFYIDWTNQAIFVVTTIDDTISGQPLTTTIRENAGETEIYGLELETSFAVTDSLFLIANYGYQKGEFQEGTDSFLERTTGNGDLDGNDVANAPNHSVILGAVVTKPLSGNLEGTLRFDYIYESEKWMQSANFNKLDSRQLANLRLSIGSDAWTLTGYVNNLLDDDTPWSSLNFVDFGNTVDVTDASGNVVGANQAELWALNPQRGRNVGVEFQYRIGGF